MTANKVANVKQKKPERARITCPQCQGRGREMNLLAPIDRYDELCGMCNGAGTILVKANA